MKRRKAIAFFLILTAALCAFAQDSGKSGYRFRLAYGPYDAGQGRVDVKLQSENPAFQWVEKTIGAVPLTETWEWQGGAGYVQGLRLALAGGEKFEAIRPWDMGLVAELIDAGLALPLDDLLEKEGQHIKALFSKEQWDQVRAIGKGKIYFFPQYGNALALRAGMIRKDWLDRVGLKVPTTRDEYLAMLRAFKAKDANGNGDPNDEIPVSGREMLRWFDDIFVMHGVAMYEGHPQWKWNAAKGIFESAQVSDDMRDAVTFLRQLYAERLMDSVMPVQKAADWQAKISSNKVGTYFHLLGDVNSYSNFYLSDPAKDQTGLKYWTFMPMPPRVPGKPQYKNIYPVMQEPNFMILKYAKDPAAIMRWYDFGATVEGNRMKSLGIEGVDWKRTGGKIEVVKTVPASYFRFLMGAVILDPELLDLTTFGDVKVKMIREIQAAGVQDLESYLMPPSIYKGFEDFTPGNAKLYREKISKMIIGELSLTEWDAYVREWYEKGGKAVTEKATAWYKGFKGIK